MIAKAALLLMSVYGVYCQTLKDIYLNTHNDLRTEEAADLPAMVWDDALASSSAAYANKCIYAHSYDPDVGENLANHGQTSAVDVNTKIAQLIRKWVADEKQFNDGSWSCCGKTDHRCCHYTQVVWKTTTSVGCGYAQCGNKMYPSMPNSILLVCQYKPKGNMIGTHPYP